MANTFLSVQYLILSQAPIKESKTQFSGSTGIYSFRDYLSASYESVSSQYCAGNCRDWRVSEQGNTLITRSQGQSKAQNKELSLLVWCFP